jgi:iron complex outermembrane receptor protein
MLQQDFAPRRRVALLGATAILAGLASGAAVAQTTPAPIPAPAPSTEQVVVTGTRLQNTNANAANPVTVITSKEIAASGAQTIEDVLQKIPAVGTSGLYGTTNNGGVGLSCTDIRNLGINRVLVLIDGHRVVHDSDGVDDCVDLNNIPVELIDHIDVLKDGASSIYGADAVAGVVNIIMKKNTVGTTATLEGSLPTERGGADGKLAVTSGETFDKGSFTIGVEYQNRSPLEQGDRNWANRINSGYIGSKGNDAASGTIPYGRLIGIAPNPTGDPTLSIPGDQRVTPQGTLVPYNYSTDSYDFAPQQDLVGGLERETLSTLGNYDFNEYMTGYLEAFYTHKTTTEQLAPEPIYTNSSSALPFPAEIIPYGNPYLNNLTENGATYASLYPNENALLRQRATWLGDREYVQDTNTLQLTGGVRGTLPYDVDYDAFYDFGTSSSVNQTKNSANIFNLEQELGYSYTPSNFTGGTYDPSVCTGACVLINPFSVSAAGANYVRFTQTDTSLFNLRTYGLDLTKKNLFELPYGDVGLAFGFDHREEHGSYNTDSLVAEGLTNESPQQPTAGGFSLNEVYAETEIPIVKDVPFFKNLSVDLSGRYFDYNTFGSGETWKVGVQYSPISDVRIRGTIGTAFRQPSVGELYTSPTNSAAGYTDPCSGYTASSPVAKKCEAQGVPLGFVSGNTQLNTLIGGNPLLNPETARTETVGVVYKPHFIPNFAFTADMFRTTINNSIGAVTLQTALDQCYTSGQLCSDIGGRDPITHEIINATTLNQNLGVTFTDGMDFGLTYNLPIGDYGAVSFNNDLEWVWKYESQNVPGGPFEQFNGTIDDSLNGNGFPRVKNDFATTWTNGPLSIGYTMEFIAGMDWETGEGCAGVLANGNPDFSTCRVDKTPNVFYHDIEATYTYRQATFTVGINNILNIPPPFVDDLTTNTAPQVYDVVGRTVFARTTFKF